MQRFRGLPLALLLLAAIASTDVLRSRDARAGEPPPPPKRTRIDLTCTGEAVPARVAPGGRGELVLRARLRDHVHVYADDTFSVLPVERAGVTYGKPVLSPTRPWIDPNYPDDPATPVWMESIEIRIPFTLASEAVLPLSVGATLKWSACDEGNCYPPDKLPAPVLVEITAPTLPAPKPPGPAGTEAGPIPVPAAPPSAPVEPPPVAPTPAMGSGGEVPPPSVIPGPPPDASPADRKPVPAGPPPLVVLSKAATLALSVVGEEVRVLFTPAEGYHLYPPGAPDADPIHVEGVDAPGVRWEPAVHPLAEAGDIREPYEVRMHFERAPEATAAPEFLVRWQGCNDFGACDRPIERRFRVVRDGDATRVVEAAEAAPPAPGATPPPAMAADTAPLPPVVAGPRAPGAGVVPATPPAAIPTIGPVATRGLLFPVTGEAAVEPSVVERQWKKWGLLFLGPIFLAGLLLAFTPCVLPLIPITVSLVGGAGTTAVPRGRLTLLLSSYVLGLALAFGTLGLVASFGGASLSAAFKSPIALWFIAGLFVVLAFGMFGVYEMQPPAALQRLLGTAKGGSVLGAFLFGAISSVIASPCTGPVIVGMLLFAAQSGSLLLGFLMFFALGLGMGAVLFAAGSVNLLMRPGPWMVWVRNGFGVVLVGGGLYYLADSGRLTPTYLFAAGFAIAVLAAVGIARRLTRTEGEPASRAAAQGAVVAVLLAVATGVVAVLTRAPSGHELAWTPVATRAELVTEVARARREGKAVVVDVWAKWCTYCKQYDRVIEESARLRTAFGALHRLRILVDDDDRVAIREGLDIPREAQPYFVFLDVEGRIVRALDVKEWHGDESEAKLLDRMKTLGALP